MLTTTDVFVHPETGEMHPVHLIPKQYTDMIPNHYYVIGSHVYRYVGEVRATKDIPTGCIYLYKGIFRVKEYKDTETSYNTSRIINRERYRNLMQWNKGMERIAQEYIENSTSNVMTTNRTKLSNTGDKYVPELRDDDDPMERVIKLMILQMNVKLNGKRSSFHKEYDLDNLCSALNGATKNMSILKFLMWCELLELDWTFSVMNTDQNVPHPLLAPVSIGNKLPLEEDIQRTKGIFCVPLKQGEDPLKRLIKVAIWRKQIDLKDYRQKGSTSHLVNNMISGLKGNQKMGILGMMNWCEILDLVLVVDVYHPATGIWYKAIGYDIYSNVPGNNITFVNKR